MPFCDNQHRAFNKKNNCSYKSLKITKIDNDSVLINCSNWNIDENKTK